MVAELYADLGDNDGAFRWLDKAYQERDCWRVALHNDFVFDPLGPDPAVCRNRAEGGAASVTPRNTPAKYATVAVAQCRL
jgi:hypothetical protein